MDRMTCITCKEEKPIDHFHARKLTHSMGLVKECKQCKTVRNKARYRSKKKEIDEKIRAWYHSEGRFARYGITQEQYKEVLRKAGGCCQLCGTDQPGGKGTWHIDHTGGTIRSKFNQCEADLVRGILCHRCNVSLGHYEKLVARLGRERIDRYLGLQSPFAKESEP
jgi:Recombination endonuclease VII